MEKYNIGDVWWIHFPFDKGEGDKRRPAIVIDDDTIAILALYVTSKNKMNPYSIQINDWKEAGLKVPSWARIDRIISISEWYMDRRIGHLSQQDLIKILQIVAEYNENISHDFSLVAVERSDKKYLQIFDERWKCWLFPYYRSTEYNKENVDTKVSEQLHQELVTTYVTKQIHCKYSVSDNVYKIYHHKLYHVLLDGLAENMKCDSFEIDGRKFKWMSFEEMENNSEIMSKNSDIVTFVKMKCS